MVVPRSGGSCLHARLETVSFVTTLLPCRLGTTAESENDVRITHNDLLGWHEFDSPDDWERDRARRIEAAISLCNSYVGSP